jgi:hypothetical protein
MKRILLAVTLFALFLPIAPQASAADVSVDFFYTNLSGGQWIDVEGYGYGWQPGVAVSDQNWRPYADGYWAYTDVGWTWVSYEDFGWATYHYGRWARLADYGWVWFPGSDLEWGPAWVSWRHGGGVVGWAPLPPRGPGISFSGGSIGFGVDVEFDIGPAYYNFVDVRYIGEPVLRSRIFAPTQNVTYINQTVNVTNITTTNNVVYNYGPDYNTLSAQSSRPIQKLKLEREQNVDATAAVKSGAITKVQGDKLVVAAPQKIQKPAKQVAPPTVKTKVAQPKLERGWSGVANEAEIKQKMKTEDHKKIPPPAGAGAAAGGAAAPGAAASPVASPAAAATAASPAGAPASPAAAAASPVEKGKARGRHGRAGQPPEAPQPGQPAATAAPAFSPAAGAPPTESPAGKQKGRRGERPGEQPGATPPTGAPAGSPESASSPPGKARGFERGTAPGRPEQPPGAPEQSPPGKRHGPPVTSPTPHLGGGPGAATERPAPRERMTGQAGGPGQAPPSGGEAGRRKPPGAGAPPSPAGEERGRGKAEGGKKKTEKESPTPAPY